MKVLHSHVDRLNVLWKELVYSQFLSAILAKRHYGNISFYSTPKLVDQVKELGMPYDEYNSELLSLEDSDTWSVPKLKVYKDQQQPFLHIDNDTFIFNKIDFNSYNRPYLFSHPDLSITGIKGNLPTLFNSVINSLNGKHKGTPAFYKDLNNTYVRLLFKLIEDNPVDLITNFDLGTIPNMNIVYVENNDTFSKATDMALSHYYNNKEVIDKEEYGPCYVEQYYIHQALRSIDSNYKKYSSKNKHTIYKKLPFSQKKAYNNVASISETRFPLKYSILTNCPCCGKQKEKKITLESKEEIVNLFDYNFEGYLHTTYLKWYDVIQAVTIHKLRMEIGDEHLRKIYNYFKGVYPKLNLPIKSGGELLYENLTEFKFEKVGSSVI